MDEYIKREDALKIIGSYSKACTEEGKVVADAIRDIIAVITPTADVAPKSEVEHWKLQCFHACMNNGCLDPNIITRLFENAEGHNDPRGADGECGLKYAKAEIAREIFEEIDNSLYKFAYPSLTAIGTVNLITAEGFHIRISDYNALKKKYTE